MPIWRREEPLHERLAREAGLGPEPAPHDPGPHWGEVGIHGIHRPRQWDAIATVDAPDIRGERALFVVLPDSSLLVEDYEFDDDLSPLADAAEDALGAPLRVEAVRTSGTLFSVGAQRLVVEEIAEDIAADELELTVLPQGERILLGDGERIAALASLEQLIDRQAGNVIRARRLDGQLWEVEFATL